MGGGSIRRRPDDAESAGDSFGFSRHPPPPSGATSEGMGARGINHHSDQAYFFSNEISPMIFPIAGAAATGLRGVATLGSARHIRTSYG